MTYSNCIKYKAGFKYQLAEEYRCNTGILPPEDIDTDFVSLHKNGDIILRVGFAWDGPSGPTIDRKENMRGSAEHDGLYRMIRYGLLPPSFREQADNRIRTCWIEDGMWPATARLEVWALKKFGAAACRPSGEPQVICAP